MLLLFTLRYNELIEVMFSQRASAFALVWSFSLGFNSPWPQTNPVTMVTTPENYIQRHCRSRSRIFHGLHAFGIGHPPDSIPPWPPSSSATQFSPPIPSILHSTSSKKIQWCRPLYHMILPQWHVDTQFCFPPHVLQCACGPTTYYQTIDLPRSRQSIPASPLIQQHTLQL